MWAGNQGAGQEPSHPRNAANKSNDNVGNFEIYHNRGQPKGPGEGHALQ